MDHVRQWTLDLSGLPRDSISSSNIFIIFLANLLVCKKKYGLGRILWIPFRIISPTEAEKNEDSD
jgi:hypothetical protein